MKRFSKAICLALLVFTLIFALVGCSTTPKQDLGSRIEVAEPAKEEVTPAEQEKTDVPPAQPAEQAEPAKPVEQPTQEAEPAKPVAYAPIERKYTLFTDGDVTVVAGIGKATITYPASIISKEDIDAAALAAYQAYSSVYDLSNVYYSVGDGVLTIYYPESWGVEELAVAEKTVMDVLPSYVASVIASYIDQAASEVVEAAKQVVDTISEEGLSASISLFGYTATVTLKDDVITIDYPDFITVDEVKAAAAAAYQAYSQYLQGSDLVINDGYATLKLSFKIGEEEFNYAVNLLESELSYYVATLLNALTEEAAEVTITPITAETAEDLIYAASISFFGYDVEVEAYDNIVKITYPSFITFDEIQAAAAVAYQAFPEYLTGSTLYVDSDSSTAVLSLAGIPSTDDMSYAMSLIKEALPSYIMSLFAEEIVAEPAAEETTEVATEVEPSLFQTSFSVFGYEVDIAAYGNQIAVSYPSFITNAEVASAARKAYAAYSQYFQGSELTIDNGTAVLSLAYNLTEDDFNGAVATLKSELTNYILALFTSTDEEEAVEEVKEVAKAEEQPAVEEPVVEEQPAAEAPATEPAKEETKTETKSETKEETKTETKSETKEETKTETKTETKSETKTETTTQPAKTETTTAAATPAKKSNAGLIVLIVVLVAVAAAAVVLFLKKKKN